MKNNKKKGFTIVELVIVIAVIGILSAILIPTFVGVTKAAQEAALKSNLANAYSMYAADAADGHVGETSTELVFYPQAEIAIVEKNGATSTAYKFGENGWATTKTSVTVDAGKLGTYGEYDLYHISAGA